MPRWKRVNIWKIKYVTLGPFNIFDCLNVRPFFTWRFLYIFGCCGPWCGGGGRGHEGTCIDRKETIFYWIHMPYKFLDSLTSDSKLSWFPIVHKNQNLAQRTNIISGSSETTKEETVQCDENISEVKMLRPMPSHFTPLVFELKPLHKSMNSIIRHLKEPFMFSYWKVWQFVQCAPIRSQIITSM